MRLHRRDDGVSEVLGSVILVVLSVVMLGAFGGVVLTAVNNETPLPPASSFTMEPESAAQSVDVRLVSGSIVTLDDTTLRLFVDGADRTSSIAVVDPDTLGEWRPGETLRITLAGDPLATGNDLMFIAADDLSGKSIGAAYATVAAPFSGSVISGNALTPELAFSPASLVTDGTSEAVVTLDVGSTFGLLLIEHVEMDLSGVGGGAAVRLYDDGNAPDTLAGDGIFSASFSVANYTYDRLPGVDDVAITATVVDVLGHETTVSDPAITLVQPSVSKVGQGVTYRDVGASDVVTDAGWLNLSAFVVRDASDLASFDDDQIELRVSDLSGTSNVWSALVSLTYDAASCPDGGIVQSVQLRVVSGTSPGVATFTPDACFYVGPDATLNLANLNASTDDDGVTANDAQWDPDVNADAFQYAAAGVTSANEALIAFFGDTLSLAPSATGLSQTDFEWAPPYVAGPATAPAAILDLSATAGDGSATLDWTEPDDGGSAITDYEIWQDGVLVATIPASTSLPYTVTGLTNGVSYDFQVRAVNAVGTASASNTATVTPAAVPGAPTALLATKGNESVSLSWTAPASDGGSAITDYKIYRGTSSGSTTTFVGATGGSNTSFVVNSLTNGQLYYFAVSAVSSQGEGAKSAEASATPSDIPWPPGSFAATAGDGQVTLSWTVVDDGGSALTDYQIYRGLTALTMTQLATTSNGANMSFIDATAVNGITYFYAARAVNANGASNPSTTDSATPSASLTAPAAPESLSATPGNASVSLSWAAPSSDGGSPITTYKVYVGTSSGSTVYLGETGGTNTTYVVNGLTNGQLYFFTVTAVNAIDESAASAETSATPGAAPWPPTSLAATRGNQSVSLSWSAPASNGGFAVTDYRIYTGTSSGSTTLLASTGGSNTSFVVNGLTNGQLYYFTVAAVNARGESAAANEASATPATVPYPPSSLVATRSDGQVTLSWTTPASNGGSAITDYKVAMGTSSGTTSFLASTGGSNTTFVVNSLTNGQVYYFTVTAVNGIGESAGSNEASATPAAAPSAPTLSATKGNATVSLSWTAPASNGGSALTTYHIYRGTSSGATSYLASTGGTNTSFVVAGLTNGQAYFFNVTAANALGQGTSSNEASATPSTVPNPPASLAATRGNATVSLSWSAPASNGGSVITAYTVYRGTSSGAQSVLATIGTNTTFTDLAVTNGVTYYYNVTATNANGASSTSNEASATPAAIPYPPATLSATAGTGQVSLSWTAGNTGGSAITAYQVWRGTSSGGESLLATIGTNLSYTDANVVAGTTYYYQIRAVNALGTSNPSVERSATPTGAGTAPNAPTNLVASPANNQVGLSWSAPTSNGTSPLTGYKVYRNGTLLATIGTNTTFTDLTALNGVTYTYHVVAYSGAGDSPASNTVTATPSAAVSVNCGSFTTGTGSVDSCSAIQYADLAYGTLDESGGGSAKSISLTFTMNLTGVTGTQTLELNGYNSKNGEDLLLQAQASNGTFMTIATLAGTVTGASTASGTVAASTYWPSGILTLRLIDAGADPASTTWKVDYVRMVTT